MSCAHLNNLMDAIAANNPTRIAASRLKTKNAKKRVRFSNATSIHGAGPARLAVGIGEAPVGLQGTFSVWSDTAALRDFAYRSAPHQQAIADTGRIGWYAEELFARFRVLSATGSYAGHDPLG